MRNIFERASDAGDRLSQWVAGSFALGRFALFQCTDFLQGDSKGSSEGL